MIHLFFEKLPLIFLVFTGVFITLKSYSIYTKISKISKNEIVFLARFCSIRLMSAKNFGSNYAGQIILTSDQLYVRSNFFILAFFKDLLLDIDLKKIEKIEVIYKNPKRLKKQRIAIQFKLNDYQHDTLVFRTRNKQQLLKKLIDKTQIQNPTLIFSPTKP